MPIYIFPPSEFFRDRSEWFRFIVNTEKNWARAPAMFRPKLFWWLEVKKCLEAQYLYMFQCVNTIVYFLTKWFERCWKKWSAIHREHWMRVFDVPTPVGFLKFPDVRGSNIKYRFLQFPFLFATLIFRINSTTQYSDPIELYFVTRMYMWKRGSLHSHMTPYYFSDFALPMRGYTCIA